MKTDFRETDAIQEMLGEREAYARDINNPTDYSLLPLWIVTLPQFGAVKSHNPFPQSSPQAVEDAEDSFLV